MKITFQQDVSDPPYPYMHGKEPIAKEFNRRQAELWKTGKNQNFNFEQISTVLLEMFAEDYNKRHSPKKKK